MHSTRCKRNYHLEIHNMLRMCYLHTKLVYGLKEWTKEQGIRASSYDPRDANTH